MDAVFCKQDNTFFAQMPHVSILVKKLSFFDLDTLYVESAFSLKPHLPWWNASSYKITQAYAVCT